MIYVWFGIAVVLGLIEAFTVNLVSIWFVISSLLAMVVSIFYDNVYIEIAVFVVVGIVLMPISKKIYSKIKNTEKTNLDRIIGMKGVVTEAITANSIGEVKVDGKKWSAYSSSDISKGEYVKILLIDSVKLKVEKWED